jgi:hypothetical protein
VAERTIRDDSVPRSTGGVSLEEYRADMLRCGKTVLPGAPGTFWVKYESFAMMRLPTFVTTLPSRAEIGRLFRQSRVPVIAHLTVVDARHPANAWLYLAQDGAYALESLPAAMRRNVRRGLAELDIRWIDKDDLLAHGYRAFCDTRTRNGLQDGTADEFERRFTHWGSCLGHVALGAWRDKTLVAFASVVDVDDWAEVEGCFSTNDGLSLRPNDALLYTALRTYLVVRGYRQVSYGLSSIQPGSGTNGLHVFKTKVGFDAIAVHRAFELHPILRPVANPIVAKALDTVLRLKPRNRQLRKAAGVLATLIATRVSSGPDAGSGTGLSAGPGANRG